MKRQISFVAALVMLITTVFSGSVFAAFSDVSDDNRYRNSIITLSQLGVIDGYEDGTFKPDGEIKRGEFTKMLITALGYGDNKKEPTEFDDITDHWARYYIKTAYDLGIINGTGERTFEPDRPVTYEQALKMLVCTLGYETTAQSKGGYPNGYLSVASDLSLGTNVVDQANSSPALRQVVAQIFYNALEVKFLEKNSAGNLEKSDRTLLKDYLGVEKVKGKLTGVEDTRANDCDVTLIRKQIAVKPTSGSNNNTIVINLGDYADRTVGELTKLIGNEMTFYYKQGDSEDDKELKILDAETTKNSTITVSEKNFISYESGAFRYWENNNRKSLKIKSDATVLYNGQAVSSSDLPMTFESRYTTGESKTASTIEELLSIWIGSDEAYNIRGEVTFTDAGDDGNVDIISINDYKTMLAYKAPTTSDYRLQNKLKTGDSLDLSPNKVDTKIYIEKDGKEIEATAIRANDVVSYTESLDGSILNLYVVNKTVTGNVNSLNTSDKTITIANTEYDLGEDCLKYIQEKEGRELTTGVSGTFYLDKLGAVVYGTLKDVAANPYAYITGVTEDLDESTAYVTAFIPSVSAKSTTTYKLADRVKVNGSTIKDYGDVISKLKDVAQNTNDDAKATGLYASGTATNIEYSQPVRIKVSGNEITEINTVDSSADVKNKQNEDSTKVALYKDLNKYYYTGSSFKKGSSSGSVEFTVNSSTTVLMVPQDRSVKADYAKKTISNAFTSNNSYWVEAYDVNKSNVASLVIVYGSSATLNEVKNTSDYSIVAKIDEEYDASEDTTTQALNLYTGTNNSSTKSWSAENSKVVADVEQGDVIQFDYDDDNKIQKVYTRIHYSDVLDVLNGTATDVSYTDDEGGTTTRSEVYNWNEAMTPTQDNHWQKFEFDFRFPQSKTENKGDKMHTSTSVGTVPQSRVCVYNVYQLIEDDNGEVKKLYLTKEGFDASTGESREDGTIVYDEYNVSSSTKMLRIEESGSSLSFSSTVEGGSDALTVRELKDAKHYGKDCSKVIATTKYGNIQMLTVLP